VGVNPDQARLRLRELADFAARTPIGSTMQAEVTRLQTKHFDVVLDVGLEALLPALQAGMRPQA